MNRRERILNRVSDLVKNFLFYDRKEDRKLPLGGIEDAIEAKEITVEEIVDEFKEELLDQLDFDGDDDEGEGDEGEGDEGDFDDEEDEDEDDFEDEEDDDDEDEEEDDDYDEELMSQRARRDGRG